MNIIKYATAKGLYTIIEYIKKYLKFDCGPYVSVIDLDKEGAFNGNIRLFEGSLFKGTIASQTRISILKYGLPSEASMSFTLILNNGGAYTVTWDDSIKWPGGTAPSLTSDGTDMLTFVTPDSGITWYGTLVGKDIK